MSHIYCLIRNDDMMFVLLIIPKLLFIILFIVFFLLQIIPNIFGKNIFKHFKFLITGHWSLTTDHYVHGGYCLNISVDLQGKLNETIDGYEQVKYKKINGLISLLKKSLYYIRRNYKKASLGGINSVLFEWLCDNYYMIEQDGKELLKNIDEIMLPSAFSHHTKCHAPSCTNRPCKKSHGIRGNSVLFHDNFNANLPYIYRFIRQAVFDVDFEFTTQSSIELISCYEKGRSVQNFELDFYKTAVRIAAIEGVCRAVMGKNLEDDTKLIGKCVRILSNIDIIDMDAIVKEKNRLDIVLQSDLANFYSKMNETTKQIYRFKISKIALKSQKDEIELAKEYIKSGFENKEDRLKNSPNKDIGNSERADHVGYYIYKDYERLFKSSINKKLFIPSQWWIALIISFGISLLLGNPFWILLILFPVQSIIRPILEHFFTQNIQSEYAPRLELKGDIPSQGQTMVVISTLLPAAKELDVLKSKLEDLYYTNGKGNITFMVLADLKQASLPVMPEDKAQIKACENLINSLNIKYNNKFMLLVRKRTFSKTGNIYTGEERKRGAITALINLIKSDDIEYDTYIGDFNALKNTKYILALDYDTKALLESASMLVSVAMHPLNQPQIDAEKGIVTQGYGIIAPKMATDLKSSLETPFTKIMCGAGGISAYDMQCSDIYQDLYDESIFSGKGLICVDTFYKLLMDVFQPETVLSHDILEGSFLRTRFVYDIELVDGFPSSAIPYFKRLHRWIRGDFQNAGFICKKITKPSPQSQGIKNKIKNPLSKLSRFKLFDNLARALNPVFAFVCMLIALITPHNIASFLAVIGFLAVVAPYIFGLVFALYSGGMFSLSRKYYSGVFPHTFELLSQIFFNLILLPQSAINALDAAVRGLYRRFVSKKKMLEWQPAAGFSHKKDSMLAVLEYFWLGELSAVLFLFSHYGFMRFFGILFALSIFLVYFSSKKAKEKNRYIPTAARDELISKVAAMWNFYCEYANESENFLPPDNVQEIPVYKIASRTSPTNIGLLLLSILCAKDFDLIDTVSMVKRINNVLNTVGKLEKWRGNLYNWYDNHTLQTLKPAYVSAVDSGNFLCCLVALKEGLRDYLSEDAKSFENAGISIDEIIRNLEIIIDDADLSVFYNKNKKLFAIGYDAQNEKMSNSYYDTLMSEARMLSYFAIAKRQVPKKHWAALSRTLTQHSSFTGPVSWTGTMFEYFMPELLLNSHEGSLSYEGLRFCLHCQKRRGREKGVPYGISESGFYAFDTELNYQYKAHGVQKIALKRGMDKDLVVSPYSTYLTLGHDFNSAYRNLRLLKRMGASGKYGHYEAVDFTQSRVGENKYHIIKSYMAHHIGMSIVAVANALNKNIMQKRFLNDKFMKSASELLQEKINDGAVIYQGVYRKETEHKNTRETCEELEYKNIYPHSPRVKLLSNGEITSIITDNGSDYTVYHGQDLTRRPCDLLRRPNGIFAAVKYENKYSQKVKGNFVKNKTIIPFSSAPDYNKRYKRSVVFSSNSISYLTEYAGLQLGMLKLLHPTLPVQQIEFAVKNTSGRKELEFYAYLEPVLTSFADDSAHPAFSKLFVNVDFDKTTQVITVQRKQRNNEKLIYLAVGFLEDIKFEYETRREKILTRPYGIERVFEGFDQPFMGKGGVPDSCIAIKAKLNFPHNSVRGGTFRFQKNFRLLVSAGMSKEEAVENIIKIRQTGAIEKNKAAKNPIAHDSIEGRISAALLPQLLFGKNDCEQNLSAIAQNNYNAKNLWSLGISGDIPIVLVELEADEEERARNYLSCHNKLRMCGIVYDLVFSYREGGEYDRPVTNMLSNNINEICGKHRIGARGGVHLADMILCGEEIPNLLQAAACHIAPKSFLTPAEINFEYKPIVFEPVTANAYIPNGYKIKGGIFAQNSFFPTNSPKLPWCHILANPQFGTLLSDKALGYTWALNSRENKLTPWYNDTMSDNRGEMLVVKSDNKYFDMINGSSVEFNPNYAKYNAKFNVCDKKGINSIVKVTVSNKGMVKYLDVELKNEYNTVKEIELAYYTEPVMGVNRSNSKQISGKIKDNILLLRNPFNQAARSNMGLTCDKTFSVVSHRPSFLCDRWDTSNITASSSINNDENLTIKGSLPPQFDMCAALIVKLTLQPFEVVNLTFSMAFACSEQGIMGQLQKRIDSGFSFKNKFTINTPDVKMNYMFNTWLAWQTLAGRVYGRTGFFQCGGAYGFRDQLQDVCSFVITEPLIAKRHIIRACAAQFEEGDVLHWWHNLPKQGLNTGKKGVRTRYTDDLLWLVYAVCEYLDATGDYSILDITVAYLNAPELEENEDEKYIETCFGQLKESVFHHCQRAIKRACNFGEHGLPLMKGGDWNDGYNKVGEKGKGESVWLAQFLSIVLTRFSDVCEKYTVGQSEENYISKTKETAVQYREISKNLLEAVNEHCWDNDRYIRAFFDNGEALGKSGNDECSIDSLTQSFSVISKMDDKQRQKTALTTAYEKLADRKNGIVKLFTPAFQNSHQNPGYVKSYPAGVRENGGQYTHAAVWFAKALLMSHDSERGYEVLNILNPVSKYEDDANNSYELEPYYMAADVYTNPYCYGRGGWSIYTGAASWYWCTVAENLLGIKIKEGRLTIEPTIPKEWQEFSAKIVMGNFICNINAVRNNSSDQNKISLTDNGKEVEYIEIDGQQHEVKVIIFS